MVTMDDLRTPIKNNWCPGCGNFGVLMALKRAIIELGIDREKVLVVSGIGCHGKIVNWVNVCGFHGIHGRVLPVATAAKLANHELTVIGHAGDGDQYDEGMEHLSHAARRNIDIALIVHDNMVFGLTTGQTAPTSQLGYRSRSTPFGSIARPINPLAQILASDGTFVARGYSGDMAHLTGLIVQAVKHRGFGFVDVFQPCVTFNHVNTYEFYQKRVYKLEDEGHDTSDRMKALEKAAEWGDRIPIGVFYKEERPILEDNLPQLAKMPLVRQPLEGADIGPIMKSLT